MFIGAINSFKNEGNIEIANSDIELFDIENTKELKIIGSSLSNKRGEPSYVIKNQGKCEILENSRIDTGNVSPSIDEATIINDENAELIMNGGYIKGEKLIYNKGKINLLGNIETSTRRVSNFSYRKRKYRRNKYQRKCKAYGTLGQRN